MNVSKEEMRREKEGHALPRRARLCGARRLRIAGLRNGHRRDTERIRKESTYGRNTEGKHIRETGNAVQDDSAGSGRG